MNVCMYVHVYVCTRLCIHVCMYMHVCTCMYVGMYLGMYMYIWGWRSGPSPPPLKNRKNKK